MQELCEHIEVLLDTHNFVVIPAFGGFVATEKGATEVNGTFYPPTKAIGFNPDLTYNDGLLAQKVAQEKGIQIDQANVWIEAQTFELIQYLHTHGHLTFGQLGSFYVQEGKILFEPTTFSLNLTSNFGLTAVYFPEVHKAAAPTFKVVYGSANANQTAATTSSKETSSAHAQAAPSSKPAEEPIVKPLQPAAHRKFNYAAVAAVLAFLMLLIPMHFGQQQSNYRASFVAPPVLEEVEVETLDNADVKPACTPYHVVIGSFYTQVKALQFLDELPEELEKSQIVYSDHRFRIIAASYETEEEGNQGAAQIARAFPDYNDAWVLLYNP